jgi:hypothetical protein
MNKVVFIALLVGVSTLLISCSQKLVPFTQEMRSTYKLSEDDLKSIQFYTSKELVLKRGEKTGAKQTEDGELTLTNEHFVEEVVIKAKTPCIVRNAIDGNTVTVEFEEGSNKYLVFGSKRNSDGFYTLRALHWNNGKGKINYGDKYYYSGTGSRDVFLSFKLKSFESFKAEQKVIKGKEL